MLLAFAIIGKIIYLHFTSNVNIPQFLLVVHYFHQHFYLYIICSVVEREKKTEVS